MEHLNENMKIKNTKLLKNSLTLLKTVLYKGALWFNKVCSDFSHEPLQKALHESQVFDAVAFALINTVHQSSEKAVYTRDLQGCEYCGLGSHVLCSS